MTLIETVAGKRVFIKGQKGWHTVLEAGPCLSFVESEAGRSFWIKNEKIQVAKEKALARKAAREAKLLERSWRKSKQSSKPSISSQGSSVMWSCCSRLLRLRIRRTSLKLSTRAGLVKRSQP
jgi:hypothetical protein